MHNIWLKISSIVLLLLIFAAITLWIAYNRLPGFLGKHLKQEVRKYTDSLQVLDYGKITIHFSSRGLSIHNLILRANPDHKNFASAPVWDVRVKHIRLSGFKILPLLRKGSVDLGVLNIDEPEIVYREHSGEQSGAAGKPSGDTVKTQNAFKDFKLDSMHIRNAAFTWYRDSEKHLAIEQAGFKANALSYALDREMPSWGEISGKISGFYTLLENELDSLLFDELQFASADSTLNVKEIRLEPRYKRIRYAEVYGYQKARNEIAIKDVQCRGLDFNRLLARDTLLADELVIDGINLDAFKDKRRDFKPGTYKPMPSERLSSVPLPFAIKQVEIRNSYVNYHEIGAKNITDGKMFFSGLNADIQNLSNDTVLLKGDAPLQMQASAYLQGKSRVELDFALPEEKNSQIVKGSLRNLELSDVNTILQTATGITIEQGTIHELNFNFTANPTYARGTLALRYSGLEVALHQEQAYRQFKKRRALSFLANRLIYADNPDKRGKERRGEIFTHRNTRKSVFAYWWQSVFSGIKPIIFRKAALKWLDKKQQ